MPEALDLLELKGFLLNLTGSTTRFFRRKYLAKTPTSTILVENDAITT